MNFKIIKISHVAGVSSMNVRRTMILVLIAAAVCSMGVGKRRRVRGVRGWI